MQLARSVIARHPASFGRSAKRVEPIVHSGWIDDIKLFATTFLAGFLFVSIWIG